MALKTIISTALFALTLSAIPDSGAQAAGGCSGNPDMKYCTVDECRERQGNVDFYCHGLDQVCKTSNSKSDNQNILGSLQSCLSQRISVNACYSPVDAGHQNAVVWVENQITNCEVIIGQQ
jgi:hypothetical protein